MRVCRRQINLLVVVVIRGGKNKKIKNKKEEKKRNKGATKGELTSINKWYELTATAASFDFAGLQEYL